MPKFFISEAHRAGDILEIEGETYNHIVNSQRMGAGEKLVICDGNAMDYHCVISEVSRTRLLAEVVALKKCPNEPPVKMALFAGLPKGDKADTIIQKSVELGAHEICFFRAARSVARILEADVKKRTERYARISLQAAQQCMRGVVPKVRYEGDYSRVLKDMPAFELAVMCYEGEADRSFKSALSSGRFRSVAVITGPEGGFDPGEVAAAREAGVLTASLGKRVLRCETAPAAALAAVLYHVGEM